MNMTNACVGMGGKENAHIKNVNHNGENKNIFRTFLFAITRRMLTAALRAAIGARRNPLRQGTHADDCGG